MKVVKRNGRTEELDVSKIKKYTSESVEGLDNVSLSELEVDAKIQFRDMITTEEIQQTLIKTAVEKIDIDRPNWTFVAARLFLYDLYHKVTGYSGYNTLTEYFAKGEKHGRIILGLKEKYDLEDLNKHIKPERDLQFQYLGIKTLYDRYLLKDEKANPIELPQHMFMAIAMFLAQNEKDRQAKAKEFYDVISKFEVMLATPTLSNARTPRHQLSSCFIGSTPDNIEGIFDAYKEMALLSKYGGGIGWDWCKVRAMGGYIDGYKNAAGGLIPFLKIANDIAVAVDQLGTRKGAIAVYIEPWHMDVSDFLDLRKNSGEERRRAHELFPALWINDIFMKRVEANANWTLFDPMQTPDLCELYGEAFEKRYIEYENDENVQKNVMPAKELWKKVLTSYFETGMPFLAWKDTTNIRNPNNHCGIIRSSNLCVTGDTRLHTQFGLVKAKDLYESKSLLKTTYDKRVSGDLQNHGVGTSDAIPMQKTAENAEVFLIDTKDGYKIKATAWHKFYVNRKNNLIKIPLNEVQLGDKLLMQSEEGQFGNEGSYRDGLLVGLTTGDGTFAIRRNGLPLICIDLYNKQMCLKEKVHTYINDLLQEHDEELSLVFKKKTPENIVPKEKVHSLGGSKKIRFSSHKVAYIYDKYYGYNKETKRDVPEFVFRGSRDTVIGYLQGLFTTDACVEIGKGYRIPYMGVKICSISRKLLEDVQLLLSNFGIRSKIYSGDNHNSVFGKKYTKKDGTIKEYLKKDRYLLSIHGNNAIKFVNNIGFLDDKQQKAEKILAKRQEMKDNNSCLSRKNEKFEVEIKSITSVGYEDVYDTTQDLNHSLIFNGLVTGNCSEIFQNTSSNHYLIKAVFEDGSEQYFEEEYDITVDGGITKKAKKLSSLDSIDGRKIYIVEKESIDGQTAVCNLASINLSKINSKEDVARVVPIAMRMLDNVIDLNFYPHIKAKKANLASRAVGLGVMGEAQMLAEKNVKWGTSEHLTLIDEVMERVSYYAINASADIAKEKGAYPNFNGSMWSKGIMPIDTANEEAKALISRKHSLDWNALREKVKSSGVRNGYMMAIAPTSSISILVGTTQTIEPVYKRKWFEHNLSGMIPNVVPNLSPDTWQFYTPAYELDQRVLVRAGAIRQKWIDQGQSLNIFISLDKASGGYLNEIYSLAWKLGVKSTYYLRSESPDSEKVNNVADRSIECEGCQ